MKTVARCQSCVGCLASEWCCMIVIVITTVMMHLTTIVIDWTGVSISVVRLYLIISLGYCKNDVTPLLTHWSYVFLALTHRYITLKALFSISSEKLFKAKKILSWHKISIVILVGPLSSSETSMSVKKAILNHSNELRQRYPLQSDIF